jgi:two-component system alkaline phosphatase synthesis response regulator PhoP
MPKILIIEDEPGLAEMYREKFIKSGFEVISSFTAEQGLEVAKKEKPDLILLDILLPKENGVTFLDWLRKEKEIAFIPVLVFSNYDDKEIKDATLKLKAKDYLIKTNHTPNEIVAKIKRLLNE